MAHIFPVGNRLDRGADQHCAHGPALKKYNAQHPGDQLGGLGATHETHGHELGESLRCAGPRPDAHQPTEQPQIQQQNAGHIGRGQGGNQHLARQVVLTQNQRPGDNAAQQRGDGFSGDPTQQHGHNRGQ